MDHQIITGLLAYGMSGKVFHAPFVHAHQGFKLHAVVERNQKQAINDYPNLISYDNVDALIADKQIDLVIVNTPNYLHFEHAKLALEAGKHVLVEKPFTATTKQTLALFELADKMNKQIFVYQNRRWDSDFLSIKKVIDSGKLGKLNEIHFRFDRYRAAIGPKLFKEQPFDACGLQYDLGPHLLDQIISLFGKPLSFQKFLGKNRPDTQVDDYFSIQLSYPNSLSVFVHANLLVVDPQAAFVLHGAHGSYIKKRTDVQEDQLLAGLKPTDADYALEKEGDAGLLTTIDADGFKTSEKIPSEKGNYMALFEAVHQAIINKSIYPITREDILAQIEILEG